MDYRVEMQNFKWDLAEVAANDATFPDPAAASWVGLFLTFDLGDAAAADDDGGPWPIWLNRLFLTPGNEVRCQ